MKKDHKLGLKKAHKFMKCNLVWKRVINLENATQVDLKTAHKFMK